MDNLPSELLEKILELSVVDVSAVKNLELVCVRWRILAEARLWYQIASKWAAIIGVRIISRPALGDKKLAMTLQMVIRCGTRRYSQESLSASTIHGSSAFALLGDLWWDILLAVERVLFRNRELLGGDILIAARLRATLGRFSGGLGKAVIRAIDYRREMVTRLILVERRTANQTAIAYPTNPTDHDRCWSSAITESVSLWAEHYLPAIVGCLVVNDR